jgi:hypothetical protein
VTSGPVYLVDSDVFITAKNLYYAFDLCPGFWESLLHHHGQGRVYSVDRVRGELLAGRKMDDLVQWVRNQLPSSFFLEVDSDEVTAAFTEIMVWAQRSAQYFDHAKAKFATGADGWLVAYARVHGATSLQTSRAPRNRDGRSSFPTSASSSTWTTITRSRC